MLLFFSSKAIFAIGMVYDKKGCFFTPYFLATNKNKICYNIYTTNLQG